MGDDSQALEDTRKARIRELTELTPEQEERLKKIRFEIQLNQITVSFSLEDRPDNRQSRKMSAFYSTNATRRVSDVPGDPHSGEGWSIEEARLVGCVLSKHAVETVYRDAVRRGIITPEVARAEAPGILTRYDMNIKKLLQNGNNDDEA